MVKADEGIIYKLKEAANKNEGIVIEFSADQVKDLLSLIAVREIGKQLFNR